MRRQVSKLATTIGLVAGFVIISGSIVGGIALAADHDDDSPRPGVSTTDDATYGQPGHDDGDHHGDDNDDQGEDVCDPGELSDDDCAVSAGLDDDADDADDHGGDRHDDDGELDDHDANSGPTGHDDGPDHT